MWSPFVLQIEKTEDDAAYVFPWDALSFPCHCSATQSGHSFHLHDTRHDPNHDSLHDYDAHLDHDPVLLHDDRVCLDAVILNRRHELDHLANAPDFSSSDLRDRFHSLQDLECAPLSPSPYPSNAPTHPAKLRVLALRLHFLNAFCWRVFRHLNPHGHPLLQRLQRTYFHLLTSLTKSLLPELHLRDAHEYMRVKIFQRALTSSPCEVDFSS